MGAVAILPNELVELANRVCKQRAETQTLELKAVHVDCPKRLYDTLSSVSNQDSGGILLFGIDESAGFEVVGVYDAQDLQKKVAEQCNQMEPPVQAVFTLAGLNGHLICSAEIPAVELPERPCYYRSAVVRVGDADLPMADYELHSFEAIREAVLNAVIHRDYSIFTEGTPIQINFLTDRLEIHSPGTLYGRMTV